MQPAEKPRIGVGIDTGRYGHRATFLRPDKQHAAKPLDFAESAEGYAQLRAVIERLQTEQADCDVHIHLDAAGQYAANLQGFLRRLPQLSISVGDPVRNKEYREFIAPSKKTDASESYAMARLSVVEKPPATPGDSPQFAMLRETMSRLKAKVGDCTRATNRLHGLLVRVFPELAKIIPDISNAWLLTLLEKYPTPSRIARARLQSLLKIPYAPKKRVGRLQEAAKQTVGSLDGEHAELLIQLSVREVRETVRQRKELEKLLEKAYQALPASGHRQVTTIPGIGVATAAVLVSKIVSLDRFNHAEKIVGYFGCCPSNKQSGVQKDGTPKPNKATRMSRHGNDLARAYLFTAAQAAVRCNPAVRALYRRLRARGTRPRAALGHCMRKLLHLVFAVWKTDRPFDPEHYSWETPDPDPPSQATPQTQETEKAAGRNRDVGSDRLAVTAADSKIDPLTETVNQSPPTGSTTTQSAACPPTANEPWLDFQEIRRQVSLEQVLQQLDLLHTLRSTGGELRGPCPIHPADHSGTPHRSFAANLAKNVFCCHYPPCQAKGNQLDLWAKIHNQTIHQAAKHLVQTFNLPTNRIEKRSP